MAYGTVTANVGAGGDAFAKDTVSGAVFLRNKISLGTEGVAVDLPGDAANGADVDVTRLPTDPVGVNADAASASGSISAKLRGIATALGITAFDLGTAAIGSRTLRGTLATDDPAVVAVTAVARIFAAAASAVTRPANTTPYTANDAVSNNATAGSVTAISFTVSDTNDAPVALERMRIASTDTGVAGKAFRAWLYRSDPTASTGVVGGDNAAFSTKQGTFIGAMVGNFKAFSDGSVAVLTPEEGARIVTVPTSGAKTVFALLQTQEAFTPSANSTTFTATLEGRQGRA